jgi:hypothetical protein
MNWGNIMKPMTRFISAGIALLAAAFALNAGACTTDAWDSVSGNGVTDSPPTVARYSEFCAYAITDGAYVQSNNASDSHYRARFYVLDGLGGADVIDIFEAYADDGATTPLFKASFNGSQFTFDATDAGGGSAVAASSNGWNLVEFDWDTGTNTFSYWVNADASADDATGSINAGTGTVEAVRLGAPNGLAPQTGKLTFDAFESHRSTVVGALMACDAQGDADIDINDALAVVDEVFGNPSVLAAGQPDCDSNGDININDVLAIVDIVF